MHNTKKYELETLVNPKLKHSYITITKDKKVILKTPYRSRKKIEQILNAKSRWIDKKLSEVHKRQTLPENTIHTLEYLQSRVDFYSDLMDLQYTQLKFRKMRRRWGSCSSQRVITLNKELLKLERELVDYVIVHELSHLKHMDHSPRFHALVEQYLPNSQVFRKELQNIQIVSA